MVGCSTHNPFIWQFGNKIIYEEDIAAGSEEVVAEMAMAPDLDERVAILARHLGELLRDRQRLLLNLEFKMYVIRHPRKRKRLSRLYGEMCLRCSMTKINTLFPEMAGAPIEKRRRLTTEVGAIMDGLALNSLFNPEDLRDEQRNRYMRVSAREALEVVRGS